MHGLGTIERMNEAPRPMPAYHPPVECSPEKGSPAAWKTLFRCPWCRRAGYIVSDPAGRRGRRNVFCTGNKPLA